MVAPNVVKFKVRHHALLLEEFTVAQIVELTGLNSASVRTEVQRMKREGLLSSRREKGKRRGAPSCVYKLTDDPEVRLELSRSVEAFYTETAPKPVEPRRPVSRHFFQAAELIRDLTCQRVEEADQEAVIDEALYHLEFARREEGIGREGTEVVGACLDREQARLETAQGNYVEAERLFQKAGVAFEAAGLHREVELTHSDWLWAQLCQQLQAARITGEVDYGMIIESLSRTISQACETKLTDSPLAIKLKEVFEVLVEKQPREMVLNTAYGLIRRVAYEGAQQASEEMRSKVLYRAPEPDRGFPEISSRGPGWSSGTMLIRYGGLQQVVSPLITPRRYRND